MTHASSSELKSGMARLDSHLQDGFRSMQAQLADLTMSQREITRLVATQPAQLLRGGNSRPLSTPEPHTTQTEETGNEHVFKVVRHCIHKFMERERVVERAAIMDPILESSLTPFGAQLQQSAWVVLSLRLMCWLLENKAQFAQVTWTSARTVTSGLARQGRLNFLWQQRDSLATLRLELQDYGGKHAHAMEFLQYRDWRQYLIDFMVEDRTMADLLLLVARHWHKFPKARHRVGLFIVPRTAEDDATRPAKSLQTARAPAKACFETTPTLENAAANAIQLPQTKLGESLRSQFPDDTLRADWAAATNIFNVSNPIISDSFHIAETLSQSFAEIGGFKVNQQFISLQQDPALQAIGALHKIEAYAQEHYQYIPTFMDCTRIFEQQLPTGGKTKFQAYLISAEHVDERVLDVHLAPRSGEAAWKTFRAGSLLHLLAVTASLTNEDVDELAMLSRKLSVFSSGHEARWARWGDYNAPTVQNFSGKD